MALTTRQARIPCFRWKHSGNSVGFPWRRWNIYASNRLNEGTWDLGESQTHPSHHQPIPFLVFFPPASAADSSYRSDNSIDRRIALSPPFFLSLCLCYLYIMVMDPELGLHAVLFSPHSPPFCAAVRRSRSCSSILLLVLRMGKSRLLASFLSLLLLLPSCVLGDSPYRFFTWNVTYGDIYPLGVKQQVCSFFLSCFFLLWSCWPSLETERDCSSFLVEPNRRRGFWSMGSSRGHRSRPSPTITSSSMSSTACRSPSSFPGYSSLPLLLSLVSSWRTISSVSPCLMFGLLVWLGMRVRWSTRLFLGSLNQTGRFYGDKCRCLGSNLVSPRGRSEGQKFKQLLVPLLVAILCQVLTCRKVA